MFHQREDILETLEEGIIAIDKNAAVIYVNPAGLRLLNAQQLSDVLGLPLKELLSRHPSAPPAHHRKAGIQRSSPARPWKQGRPV